MIRKSLRKRVIIWPRSENRQMWKYATRIKEIGRESDHLPDSCHGNNGPPKPVPGSMDECGRKFWREEDIFLRGNKSIENWLSGISFSAVTFQGFFATILALLLLYYLAFELFNFPKSNRDLNNGILSFPYAISGFSFDFGLWSLPSVTMIVKSFWKSFRSKLYFSVIIFRFSDNYFSFSKSGIFTILSRLKEIIDSKWLRRMDT